MNFQWDERKNEENIRKHGIDFADAVGMFSYPMLVALDTRRDYGEDRWIGIGILRNMIAAIVYIEWENEETIRILSARKATTRESQEYHKRVEN